MKGMDLKEVVICGAGIFILLDRGASWVFILGIALIAVGATRLARNLI